MPDTINIDKLCMGCMSIIENPNEPCPKCGYDRKKDAPGQHQLKPYTILSGKYLVGKVLGEGGFGITYLGWDLNLDIKIALKEYYPAGLVTREITSTGTSSVTPFSGDKKEYYQNGLEKFVNEAKSLAKFYTLPGIVAVKDFFRENGTAYIVMEFVNGITLKQHLSNSGGKIRPNEVFELMRPLMKSLSQIHAEGIIHRDISPDNIMLTNKGDVKLLDFGAARDFLSDGNKSLSVLLKPGYAPEEQYRTKGKQGPWTDVYALCATIYKMITGITPPESLDRFRKDELIPPSTMGIKLSSRTENALMKGMAVFESDRYQSIDELCSDIYVITQDGKTVPANNGMQPEHKVDIDSPNLVSGQDLDNTLQENNKEDRSDTHVPPDDTGKTADKRKFKIAAIIAACAALVLIAVILISSGTAAPDTGNAPNSLKMAETTTSNIISGGIVAQQGNWIYYSNASDNRNLYKVQIDGTKNTKLNSNSSCYINVVDDWVYYSSGDNRMLYKIRTDGANETMLSSDESYYVSVVNGWIYYTIISISDSASGIYKIRTDGTEKTMISKDSSSHINVVGDWIYYSNIDDNSSIYKIRTDGTGKTKINSNNKSYNINVVGNWIYYRTSDDSPALYKIRTDGTQNTKLISGTIFFVNVVDDWIYYSNMDDGSSIYKIRTDGTQNIKINSDYSWNVSVVNNLIYYVDDRDKCIYTIHTDGTNRQKFGETASANTGKAAEESPQNTVETAVGNTPGNIINGGLAAQKDNWIYYSNINGDNGHLYKIHTDGTQNIKINNDPSYNINVIGDWIYYSSDNDYIYKIHTDGTQRTRLNSDNSGDIYVIGDWIYYCNSGDNNYIYKIRTDGTQRIKVSNDSVSYMNVIGDWIYYGKCSEIDKHLYKIHTDGTQGTMVNDDRIFMFNSVGDWIYYPNISDSNYLYKIRTDGTQRAMVNNDRSNWINVSGDWIYYSNLSDNDYLYKIRTDGTQKTRLNSIYSYDVNIVGDWIYYMNKSHVYTEYKIRIDGTENQVVK